MRAIILAAGVGKRLKNYTQSPKCLIKIKNEPLLKRHILLLKKSGINDIVIVAGYQAEEVIRALKKYRLKVKIIKNNDFSEGSILSLWAARDQLQGEILLLDADLYFERRLLERVYRSKKSNFFLIDTKAKKDNEAVRVGFKNNRAVDLARGLKGNYKILGEWSGLLKLSSSGSRYLRQLLEEKVSSGERKMGYEFIIPGLFRKIAISYELIDDLKWVEIDFPKDVKKAKSLNIE